MHKEINSDTARDMEVFIMEQIFFKILDMLISAIISYIVTKLADDARTNKHKKKIEKIRERANIRAKSQNDSKKHHKMIMFNLELRSLKIQLTIK